MPILSQTWRLAADNIVYTAEVDHEPNDFDHNMSGMMNGHPPYYNESYEFNTTFNPDHARNERKVVRGGSWKDSLLFKSR